MSKISREDNKKRFKTGMYPTQQDFENVFDSYVHKDDTIDPSKIVSGDENIVDIINRKAEERHNHSISEVDNLGETLQQIQDDLDTAEDNIAGHETRIVTLEAAKTDYEAFKERVRAFLEDANASDTTIDRWHEIENFLQGITDTETLTGLLNDLKQEILSEIPEPQPKPSGNYLELVEDLDAYTDAPDGKIVKYVGQTNEKYTRGFDYERVAGDVQTLFGIQINGDMPKPTNDRVFIRSSDTLRTYKYSNWFIIPQGDEPAVGDVAVYMPNSGEVMTTSVSSITSNNGNPFYSFANGMSALSFSETQVPIYCNNEGVKIAHNTGYNEMELPIQVTSAGSLNFILLADASEEIEAFNAESATVDMFERTTPSTWQPIQSFNVIN